MTEDKITHQAVKCPFCDYWTGIRPRSQYGEQNARGALTSHLCRKKHALTRAEAHARAKQAEIITVVWSDRLGRFCSDAAVVQY